MKKLVFITAIVFVFASITTHVFANTTEIKDYVVTENGITYVMKLRNGVNNNLIGITNTGEKINFDKTDVKSFRIDGREFKRLYLVEEGTDYVKSIFLEKLNTRTTYSLYKKVNTISGTESLSDFYVYYNDTLEFQLNQDNYKVVLSFFYPRFNLLFANIK